MKRLILGILVVFGLMVSGAMADADRLFWSEKEKLEKYEDLKKEWEALKESAKDTKTFGECHTYPYPTDDDLRLLSCGKYTDIRMTMEKLEYADSKVRETGNVFEARKATAIKYKLSGLFDPSVALEKAKDEITLLKAKLMEIGGLRGYNEFKAKMAKCKLSGDKECVEE